MLYRFLPWVLGITFLFLLVDVRSQRRCGQQRMPNVHSDSPWPWMVAISVKGEYNSDYSHYCSGFLIDHLHVITAAHCLNERNLTEYQAHIGHVDRTRGKKYSIVKMVIHDNYTGGRYYNNIGMMTLDRPVTEPGFNPVCLPMEEIRRLNLDNERAALVGWGRNPFGCGQRMMPNVRSDSPWPWMVSIYVEEPYNPRSKCSGFLIDHIHVLTAAYCLEDKNLTHYQASIGHVDLTRGENYSIVSMVIHENYTGGKYYSNIGMLTLDRPVTVPGFNPVCLPTKEVRRLNLDNERATVVGWGRGNYGETMVILQQLKDIPVISNEECERAFSDMKSPRAKGISQIFPEEINSKMMCAGGRHTCRVASGSPLMIRRNNSWHAVGIAIFGIGCGFEGIPAGFTRVSEYLEWICEKTFEY